jgi:RNA polymerase sigma factor (sigma-70 family)
MKDSTDLLHNWAEHDSEEAFAEIVARHIDLVHSVAVRKVAGDTGLAAEVTQTVFTDLARKARWLRAEGSLAGWLHRHTCFTAATVLRGEIRRRAREQTAAAMHALENETADWPHLAPLLDDAVNALGNADRRAVLLRFYERRDLRDVGFALGVGEDAAQKRVTRALDKLRGWLAKRGITSTGAALAVTLTAHSVAAAPAGLAATVTTTAVAAVAGTAAGVGTLTLLEFMTHFKTKLAIGAAVAAVVATPVVWQEKGLATTRAENRALAAQVEPLEPLRAEQSRLAQMSGAGTEAARAVRDRGELDRLRKDVPAMRERLQQMQKSRVAATSARVSTSGQAGGVPAGFIRMQDARDVGAATGETLAQTFLWAVSKADTNRVLQLGDWSADGAGEQAERMMRELSAEAARGKMDRDSKEIVFRVVRQVALDDGDSALVIDMGKGTNTAREAMRIRRAGNEWRVVIGKHGPERVGPTGQFMRD